MTARSHRQERSWPDRRPVPPGNLLRTSGDMIVDACADAHGRPDIEIRAVLTRGPVGRQSEHDRRRIRLPMWTWAPYVRLTAPGPSTQ